MIYFHKIYGLHGLQNDQIIEKILGRCADNQNGNLRWHKFPDIFLPHFYSFAIESYIYETDFTLQKYHFEVLL